ncbi:MAG: ATP synthase F1 subunit delta [Chitinispirillaceae bacterium]|nr:ATP synthase F1 subunit delta [Chitinispirillaceae bacterium]
MRERYVAREYARLLLRHAPGECAAVKPFFRAIAGVMAAEPLVAALLSHPAVPREVKINALLSIAAHPPGPLVVRMLDDLVKRRVIGLFAAVAEEMENLADEARNIAGVVVTSATALPETLRKVLSESLSAYTRGGVKIQFAVDPALCSGLLIRIGDTIIDNSIKTDLERIRQKLQAVSST